MCVFRKGTQLELTSAVAVFIKARPRKSRAIFKRGIGEGYEENIIERYMAGIGVFKGGPECLIAPVS